MAESLDDGEFWLPPQFLYDDDDVLVSRSAATPKDRDGFGFQADGATQKGGGGFFSFDPPVGGFESLGGSSDLSSPSTETESDEEELVAGLARQMARSTIGRGRGLSQPPFASDNAKARPHARSPQSTLCAVGSRVMSRQGSNVGSPNGPRQVSPPATWDLLYAAAGEVARMRMNNKGFMAKQSQVAVPDGRLNPQQSLYHQRLQAAKFHLMKQQQMLMQQRQHQSQSQSQRVGIRVDHLKGTGHFEPQHVLVHNRPSGGPLSARPPPPLQQQQNVSGMRAVFLGAKRECAGTGVFFPLRHGGEKRKKPACPVLLPARVVQALNLNLDEMGPEAKVLPCYNDGQVRLSSERRGKISVQPQPGEVRLPQEWIY